MAGLPVRCNPLRGARAAAAWLALALVACASPPAPVLDARFPDGRRTLPLESLAAGPELAPGQAVRVDPVGRDAGTSHHVVHLRGGETPHRHDRHDLLVVLLRGHGTMRLGDEARVVGAGSILYVPRGTVHAFRNASSRPAVAYVVYVPPFDGTDRVPVE